MDNPSRAKTDYLDSGKPLLPASADMVHVLEAIVDLGVIDLDHPGSVIASSPNEDLTRAADRARLIVQGLGLFARVSTRRYGRDHAGLSVLSGFDRSDPTLIALAVQLAIHLPSLLNTPQERENAANTFAAIQQHLDAMRCIELFSKEHPGYAFIFKPREVTRVQALTGEERELLKHTADSFLARHPECAALM